MRNTGFGWFCWTLLLFLPSMSGMAGELRILSLPNLLNAEILNQFETRYGTRVTEIHFNRNSDRVEHLLNNDGRGYDLALLDGMDLQSYTQRGWLQRLDAKQLPNLKHLGSRWREVFKEAKSYGLPYTWGTIGILYRRDQVSEPIVSWSQLFYPDEKLRQRIGMIDEPGALFDAALKTLGHSINSQDPRHVRQAGEVLRQQAPYVQTYRYTSLGSDAPLISGEHAAAIVHSGDAVRLQQLSQELVFVVPFEGSDLRVQYFAMMADSKQPSLAYQFLNFLCEPKVASQLAANQLFATTNQSAELLLPRSLLSNPSIYPSFQALEERDLYRTLSPRLLKYRNDIYLSLTE